jgi:hypothetical protein
MLLVTMEAIEEQPGFELIDVNMPSLVTVRESDEQPWLVHGDQGGSLAMLSQAKPGSLPLNNFWGNIQGTLPIVMVGTAHARCVQETTSYMDGTLLQVSGENGSRRASIGTDKVHRVNGGLLRSQSRARDAAQLWQSKHAELACKAAFKLPARLRHRDWRSRQGMDRRREAGAKPDAENSHGLL